MGAHNGPSKDQLTTHGIFRDALAGREIRLNCRQMDSAVSKIAFFQRVRRYRYQVKHEDIEISEMKGEY